MRSMTIVLAVAAVAVFSNARPAEPEPAMTAGDLQQLCTGEDHVSRNACRIYILGVTQGISVGLRMAEGAKAARPCVPPGVSAEALERAVKGRLAEDLAAHPKDQERDASGFVGSVLGAAFPCRGP